MRVIGGRYEGWVAFAVLCSWLFLRCSPAFQAFPSSFAPEFLTGKSELMEFGYSGGIV